MDDDTTQRLEEASVADERALVTAVRWTLPDGRTQVSSLDRQRQTLGRGEGQDIRLETSGVSRAHAEVQRQGPIYALHDCGSTNGTLVNGKRVEHTALSPGDVIRLGDAVGVVVRAPHEQLESPGVTRVQETLFGPGLANVVALVRRAGPTTLPVIVQGETGSGKERVARAVHDLSQRSGPFHAVNCAALPANLAEAELFGHRKGAFTGAEQSGLGHFRAARGGSLFLDELAELPLSVQAKLLRALQEGEVTPVGETQAQRIDVRLIAAVQRPIEDYVAEGKLRDDLAMRLRGLVIPIAPLRRRREDIPLLLRAFLERYSGGRAPGLEPRLLERLLCHDWPGNVRELELLARQLLALHGHELSLRRSMLPPSFSSKGEPATSEPPARADRSRSEHDLERLSAELATNGGNLARAAATTGISRQRAYRLLGSRGSRDE